ncbi:sigma-54-dependent Fis family transcriptional regulator [Fusibacter bizertensis]
MALSKIISNVQLICEAIASVVNIDVTIVDHERVRLAGTGRYRDSIGEKVNENSAFSYALRESLGFIIENPGEHQACTNCDCKEKCNEHAEVCCPIRVDGKTVGVIGLIAFKEDQRQALIKNQENLMSFLDRMADLIASKLKEYESHEAIELLAKELEVVFESIDTSLIACDKMGKILRVNRKFKRAFGVENIENLDELLYKRELTYLLNMKENSKNHFQTFKNGLQGIFDVSLIKVQQAIKGYIITIKTLEEVMSTVNDMVLDSPSTGFDQIIGNSKAMTQVKDLAQKVAGSASTVLILGESGTGKELFARAIHYSSSRQSFPFVAINCAAIPDQLLESELFGYEEGAFTGAKKGGKPGKFQLANRGTLFLDEIGDMPLHLQAKLLRVLQEKRIDRLGGSGAIEVDVRVIAATHANLEEKVNEGTFRQDLYYRLNVIPLNIPPLRERKDDLMLTANHLISKWCSKLLKPLPKMSDAFRGALLLHEWTGNVRELENAVEYAINVCEGDVLEIWHLPKRLANIQSTSDYQNSEVLSPSSVESLSINDWLMPISKIEEKAINVALTFYGCSGEGLEKAAKSLGISRATLYRKIK